eukprot:CAMPEP_0195653624 /NCGR_PEP_ID=MMETSP0815-20121206/33489_1 /TAXON_ID=97485 /ORGANISM="Prymnesium parvum, Strain Texoma1" /LENGTH=102 /DNA_ID=CAMNT_0040797787 /DNA_START=510 /DNA_END=813 /DNA_ORIENTATION=+
MFDRLAAHVGASALAGGSEDGGRSSHLSSASRGRPSAAGGRWQMTAKLVGGCACASNLYFAVTAPSAVGGVLQQGVGDAAPSDVKEGGMPPQLDEQLPQPVG